VATSVHVSGGGLLVAGGLAFGILAATGRGPTGVVRVCPPRLHAAFDLIVAAGLALAPILPALRPDVTGIIVIEFAAVGWIRLTTLTAFTPRRAGEAPSGSVPGPVAPSAVRHGARRLGQGAGRARRAWRRSTGPRH